MTTFDHLKLVRRDPVEMARFRRCFLGGQAGNLEGVAVLHEADGRCCKREPWNQTATRIISALKPPVPQLLVNMNEPAE